MVGSIYTSLTGFRIQEGEEGEEKREGQEERGQGKGEGEKKKEGGGGGGGGSWGTVQLVKMCRSLLSAGFTHVDFEMTHPYKLALGALSLPIPIWHQMVEGQRERDVSFPQSL